MAEIKARLKIRQGAAGAWAALNPVLLQGELGYETDTKRLRVGDGVAAFTALPFITVDATSYQSASEKLTAINALTWAANKLIYTTGTNTAAVTDLSAFMRTILPAADPAALWTLLTADLEVAWEKLYLGSLAGKSKISVPGDINATGTPADWTVLRGDGVWSPIFGLGQSWQGVTGSRAADTTYQNTTNRTIVVKVQSIGTHGNRAITAGPTAGLGFSMAAFNASAGFPTVALQAVIPAGWYYRYTGVTIENWDELR